MLALDPGGIVWLATTGGHAVQWPVPLHETVSKAEKQAASYHVKVESGSVTVIADTENLLATTIVRICYRAMHVVQSAVLLS